MRSMAILAAMAATAAVLAQPLPSELESAFAKETDLKFDAMFPRRPYTGKSANAQGWSPDDRYFAYTWNPYATRGMDLWLYDSKTGKSEQLTSIEMMAKIDRDAKLAIDFFKKEDERLDQWDKLSDKEWRIERQKLREEREKPGRKPDPSYGGISGIEWSKKKNEFLMVFKGDVWRWKVGDKAPVRLTQTRDAENSVQWLPDDSGFVFQRGNGVYRMKFGSEFVRQINPEMPEGVTFGGFQLSPDGKQMLVFGNKTTGQDRQVDYIVYRNRFAEARKTSRGVSEDDFRTETTLYLFDITDQALDNVENDQKPFEIYKWAGGEEWYDLSTSSEAWAPDSSSFVFASWKRDKKELIIHEANLARKRVRAVYTGTSDGEHRTPSLCEPFYSADGKTIYGMLDKSGWRHLHAFDRISGAERQVTSGEFEVYPLQVAADKKGVLVRSSRENGARMNLYRVNPENGEMSNLTRQTGMYGQPDFAHKSDSYAVIFNSWNQLRELYINDGKAENVVTDSHKAENFWKNAVKIKPELFQFKNRHGDTISGFLFVPPNLSTGGKRPLWMYVYGGPLGTGKSVNDGSFGSSDFMFNQYLAYNHGYVTATIDPRGSSGYNARFGKANFENPGVAQTEDLADAAKYLASRYPIDTNKVGLNGWSFGGWQTQHAMYHAPETFTLGIAGAGPTEWQNYNTWYTGGVIGNTPKGKGDYLDKFSLTKFAGNLKSPLLLLHGVEDTNVLFQDTVMVYRKLLQAGKGDLVELSLDPTGGHGMGGDMDTRDRHMIYLSFILRHWGSGK